ncbi:hypothetical protein VNO80_11174 [Phaseolus coccineus]|uniref:Uncharacterized protein n=1 Tax=Phaseolus coccineus TaxID=3886 RepID=A0AAN9RB54_PHACN
MYKGAWDNTCSHFELNGKSISIGLSIYIIYEREKYRFFMSIEKLKFKLLSNLLSYTTYAAVSEDLLESNFWDLSAVKAYRNLHFRY